MAEKKEKGKNFTQKEEDALTRLVTKYWNVIECKKTDHANNM